MLEGGWLTLVLKGTKGTCGMTPLIRLVALLARGVPGRSPRLVLPLLAAATLSLAMACDDDPVDEGLDPLPTSIGTSDVPAEEADAVFTYSDVAMEPASMTLPPQGVVITLRNEGTFDHEFVLIDSEDLYEVDQLPLVEGGTVDVGSLTVLGEVEPFPPGETRSATAELAPGTRYIAFCNVPGHYQAGVRAEIETAGE